MLFEQCAENEERLALNFFVDRTGHMRYEQRAENEERLALHISTSKDLFQSGS